MLATAPEGNALAIPKGFRVVVGPMSVRPTDPRLVGTDVGRPLGTPEILRKNAVRESRCGIGAILKVLRRTTYIGRRSIQLVIEITGRQLWLSIFGAGPARVRGKHFHRLTPR
jgi:hypothetical protein